MFLQITDGMGNKVGQPEQGSGDRLHSTQSDITQVKGQSQADNAQVCWEHFSTGPKVSRASKYL